MTKQQIIKQYFQIITSEEVEDLTKRLLELVYNNRITYGAYLGHNFYDNYHAKQIQYYIPRKSRIKKDEFVYHLKNMIKDFEANKKFIKEQENIPFEKTQMQLLIANGKIRYE